MISIITNSEFQKNIGAVSKMVHSRPHIVTVHGKAQMIVLPYFEDGDNFIDDYFEEYEIWKNKKNLQKELQKSYESGDSDLIL